MTKYQKNRKKPKTPAERYFERRARRRWEMKHQYLPVTLAEIADRDFLFDSYRENRRYGGQGAGIDDITYSDLSNSEVGNLLGQAGGQMLAGTYRPVRKRELCIPKPGKKGHRKLRLSIILDRAVGKALLRKLEPYWEKRFLKCSYGFRPRKSCWQMLANIELAIIKHRRYCLAVDDVKCAFDNVPIDEVLKLHRSMLEKLKTTNTTIQREQRWREEIERIVSLLEQLLKGGQLGRQRGIDQGHNYSPLALNVLFHELLDVPIAGTLGEPFWFRYADNLVYLCQNVIEGKEALCKVQDHLKPLGMTLKGEDGVIDLSKGETIQILGLELSFTAGQIHYALGNQAISRLKQSLSDAHHSKCPPEAARSAILGWIDYYGPAFANGVSQISVIVALATSTVPSYRRCLTRKGGKWLRCFQ